MTAAHDRTAAIEGFYRAHRAALEQQVANRVRGADRFLIEDACQFAWTVLLRRPDISLDEHGFAWLATVATREGWRAARPTDVPAGPYAFDAEDDGLELHPGRAVEEQVIDREEHHARVAVLRRLKPVERQALVLKAAGYSYQEIGELTAASYTAVNRRLSEAAPPSAGSRPLAPEPGRGRGGENAPWPAIRGMLEGLGWRAARP